MGRTKNFSSEAFATLSGSLAKTPAPVKKAISEEKPSMTVTKKEMQEEVAKEVKAKVTAPTQEKKEVVEQVQAEQVKTEQVKARSSSQKTSKTTKRVGESTDNGLQNPHKRSIKSRNGPVTFYLNSANVEKFKAYAESLDQKPSWILDELLYEYMAGKS